MSDGSSALVSEELSLAHDEAPGDSVEHGSVQETLSVNPQSEQDDNGEEDGEDSMSSLPHMEGMYTGNFLWILQLFLTRHPFKMDELLAWLARPLCVSVKWSPVVL